MPPIKCPQRNHSSRSTGAKKAKGPLSCAQGPEVGTLRLGRYPFSAAIKHYLEKRYGTVSDTTYDEEERKLRYLAGVFESLKNEGRISTTDPRRMGRKEVQEFLAWMRDPRAHEGKALDPTAQSKYMQYLNNFLKAFKNHVIADMKADGVRFPRETKKPIRVLGTGDLQEIFDTLETKTGWRGSVARGMIALYFATGVRPKEARLAHLEDLDLKRMTFYVRHPKGEGSWASPTEVAIIRPDVVPLIKRYLQERKDELRRRGHKDAAPLFPNVRMDVNTFYSANAFYEIKHEVELSSGVDFKLKDFRSTLTSITVNGDMSLLPAMSAQLRHTNLATTQRSYYRMEQGVAGRQLRDAWKGTALNTSSSQKPVIDNKFEPSGYA